MYPFCMLCVSTMMSVMMMSESLMGRANNQLVLFKVWFWGEESNQWSYFAAWDWRSLLEYLDECFSDNVKKIEDVGTWVEVVNRDKEMM